MHKTKILLGCGLPLLLVVGLAVYGAKSLKTTPKAERSETVDRGNVEIKVTENGDIQPLKKVEVKSKVGGRILKLLVEEGERVHVGQRLATIDPQEVNTQVAALQAQLAAGEARLAASRKNQTYQKSQTATGIDQYIQNLASARARYRSAEAEAGVQPEMSRQSIAIAQANLDAANSALKVQVDSLKLMADSTHPQAVVNAQSEYDRAKAQNANALRSVKRQEDLLAQGYVPQQTVDTAETDQLSAEATLREAKQKLDRIEATNQLEEDNAHSQIASARSNVQQMEAALLQAKATTLPQTKQHDLENARASVTQAQAQLTAARSGKTQDSIRGDEATAAQAEVRQIRNQLEEVVVHQNDTTIIASMDGVITKRYVEAGELITSAIGSFSSGTAIFQISDLATMLVKINVNEVDINKTKVGLPVDVMIDSAKNITFPGHVRKVSPSAMAGANDQASSNNNRGQSVIKFAVEVQIDRSDPRLKPGMSARCAVIVDRRKNVLRLPTDCVTGTGDAGKTQIVTTTMKDGKPVETAAPHNVKIGLRGDDFVEIVSGLKEGDKARPAPFDGPPRKEIDFKMDH